MKYNFLVWPDVDEEQINKLRDGMLKGNIPAMLQIIMHNQGILNDKLNKLLPSKEKNGRTNGLKL